MLGCRQYTRLVSTELSSIHFRTMQVRVPESVLQRCGFAVVVALKFMGIVKSGDDSNPV
jgi:hypothetical protein